MKHELIKNELIKAKKVSRVHPKLSFFIFVLMTLLKFPVIARHEAIPSQLVNLVV